MHSSLTSFKYYYANLLSVYSQVKMHLIMKAQD